MGSEGFPGAACPGAGGLRLAVLGGPGRSGPEVRLAGLQLGHPWQVPPGCAPAVTPCSQGCAWLCLPGCLTWLPGQSICASSELSHGACTHVCVRACVPFLFDCAAPAFAQCRMCRGSLGLYRPPPHCRCLIWRAHSQSSVCGASGQMRGEGQMGRWSHECCLRNNVPASGHSSLLGTSLAPPGAIVCETAGQCHVQPCSWRCPGAVCVHSKLHPERRQGWS